MLKIPDSEGRYILIRHWRGGKETNVEVRSYKDIVSSRYTLIKKFLEIMNEQPYRDPVEIYNPVVYIHTVTYIDRKKYDKTYVNRILINLYHDGSNNIMYKIYN